MAVQQDVTRAIDLALAEQWDDAHTIAQANEGHPLADWLHAILHRIEGDESNARYWYRQAKRDPAAYPNASVELMAIKAACTG